MVGLISTRLSEISDNYLDLSNWGVVESDVSVIIAVLNHKQIATLNLERNNLFNEGLINLISNTQLLEQNAANNNITSDCISDIIKNRTLKRINLSATNITGEDVQKILESTDCSIESIIATHLRREPFLKIPREEPKKDSTLLSKMRSAFGTSVEHTNKSRLSRNCRETG
jgi:hypothetical protein